jgi:hypothetical protein
MPNVRWLINDKVVEGGDENIQISENPSGVHSLRIGHTNPAQSGRVLAQAENTQGRAESAADLQVKSKPGPPYFSREPQDHEEVTEGEESVKFSAIVHGEPQPTVYWLVFLLFNCVNYIFKFMNYLNVLDYLFPPHSGI